MELKELRQKSPADLKAHLLDLHKEQFSLRMQKATGQLAKTHDIRLVRREIARVNMLLTATKQGLSHERISQYHCLKTVEGRVVSNKMNKTVTVLVERQVKHALYGKYIRRSTKLHAHDEDNACNEGDLVRVTECRPMSKTKNWRVVEVVRARRPSKEESEHDPGAKLPRRRRQLRRAKK